MKVHRNVRCIMILRSNLSEFDFQVLDTILFLQKMNRNTIVNSAHPSELYVYLTGYWVNGLV